MQATPSIFTPLERALLSELTARLRPDAADLFARQLQGINLIQRHANSREVCCYSMKHGTVHHDPTLQFANQDRELRLATIVFSCMNSERHWTAKFFVVQGYFFSIVFDGDPKMIHECDTPNIEQLQIHYDPMQVSAHVAESKRASTHPDLPDWINILSERGPISNINKPLSMKQRESFIHQLNTRFPADYLELVEQCDGLTVGVWSILGLSEVYEVHLPDSDYIALAELHGFGMLMLNLRDEFLYYSDFEEETLSPAGSVLAAALIQFQDKVAP